MILDDRRQGRLPDQGVKRRHIALNNLLQPDELLVDVGRQVMEDVYG
jgi:hypothetical protein